MKDYDPVILQHYCGMKALSDDKHRFVRDNSIKRTGADVIVTEITTTVCDNAATVMSCSSCISYAFILFKLVKP